MIELIFFLAQAAGKPLDYREAKLLADRQEASLTSEQTSRLIASQAAVAGNAFAPCIPKPPPQALPSFTVVLKLDASGRVTGTWLLGETEFALGRSLLESGRDFSRAMSLARRALEHYGHSPASASARTEIEKWLERRVVASRL